MTESALIFCLLSMLCSSTSQLCMKASASYSNLLKFFIFLSAGCLLQLISVIAVVTALKTIQLTQLIPFAAAAYLLVPIGSYFIFKEQLLPKFWIGALFIMIGIICTNS